MKTRIGIPETKIHQPLYHFSEEAADKYDLQIVRASEMKIAELMFASRLEAALLTPEGYGMAVKEADYRVIPGPALALINYTGSVSIYMKEGLDTLRTCAAADHENFLVKIGRILLAENYNIHPEKVIAKGTSDELLEKADSAIVQNEVLPGPQSLDVSEDWFTLYEMPLPVSFWVCREEEYPKNILEIVEAMAAKDLLNEEDLKDFTTDDHLSRKGSIMWRWNEQVKNALGQVLQLLFFHQIIPEIPAVKVLGEDTPAIEESIKA